MNSLPIVFSVLLLVSPIRSNCTVIIALAFLSSRCDDDPKTWTQNPEREALNLEPETLDRVCCEGFSERGQPRCEQLWEEARPSLLPSKGEPNYRDYRGYIGLIGYRLGICGNDGKENGNYCNGLYKV